MKIYHKTTTLIIALSWLLPCALPDTRAQEAENILSSGTYIKKIKRNCESQGWKHYIREVDRNELTSNMDENEMKIKNECKKIRWDNIIIETVARILMEIPIFKCSQTDYAGHLKAVVKDAIKYPHSTAQKTCAAKYYGDQRDRCIDRKFDDVILATLLAIISDYPNGYHDII